MALLERVPVPASITGGTWRLKAPGGAALPTYADSAGAGASTDPVAAGTTRYAPPGAYLLEHVEGGAVLDRVLYVNAPEPAAKRLAMTADAVVGFYGATPVARGAALTGVDAAAVDTALYGARRRRRHHQHPHPRRAARGPPQGLRPPPLGRDTRDVPAGPERPAYRPAHANPRQLTGGPPCVGCASAPSPPCRRGCPPAGRVSGDRPGSRPARRTCGERRRRQGSAPPRASRPADAPSIADRPR